MTDFIIHIGDGKCGSSSIQRAMYSGRSKLGKQNLVYETSVVNGGHFGLVTLAGRPIRGDSNKQKVLAEKTVELIQKACGKKDTVVLSAESFFSLKPPETMKILDHITKNVGVLDIIAYIRPPHSQYLSTVQQALKGDKNFWKPDEYHRSVTSALKHWRGNPHVRKLVVRKFDRDSLYKGDVVQDFAAVMSELSGKTVKLDPVEANISLSAEQMVVLQRFRREILRGHDGKLHPDSQKLIRFFQGMNNISLMGNKAMLARSALATVCMRNAEEVANLNKMFPDLKMEIPEFDKDASDDESWKGSEDVSSILASVDEDDVNRLVALIPQFSPDLSKGMTPDAQSSLQQFLSPDKAERAKQARFVRQFWNGQNCSQAVADFETVLA